MKHSSRTWARKVIGAITVGLATVIALTACTIGGTADKAAGPVTLTFLNHYGSDPMKSGITDLITEWNEQNPDIQVKQQVVNFDDLLTTLNVRQAGGRGADVVSSYALWGGQLAANGVLDKAPAKVAQDIKTNYSASATAAVSGADDQVFGYPTELNTYVLFYNKKLLAAAGYDKPPASWDELEQVANKTTRKDSKGNYKVQGISLIQAGDNQTAHPFLSLLDSTGGTFLKADGTSALDDRGRSVMALESRLAKSGATTTSLSPLQTFPSGHVAMAIQAGWWIGSLKAQMKKDYAEVGTAPIPGPQSGQQGSLAYAFFTGVNSGSKHKAEAWRFLTWLNSHKADGAKASEMGIFLADNGLIPPRKADADALAPKYLSDDPNLEPIYDAAGYAMAESNAANAYEAKTALHNTLNEILVKKAPVDQSLTDLNREIDNQ
jgi:multiple sugar transport system substrate-binding protein